MTEQSFEYKALRFLNDRFELYDISDHDLKTALFDIPLNEYNHGMTSLREIGYIKNKDLYEKGLTITEQGKVRLQQMQRVVDSEKKQPKTRWERITPIRDLIGTIGVLSAIFLGWLTWYGNKENADLKSEVDSLKDSISFYKGNLPEHKNDTISILSNKIYLPQTKRSIGEIDKIVSEIEKGTKEGIWKSYRIYGINNEPCEIIRYYKDNTLVQIEIGCGDCQNVMSSENYYFEDNSLICLKTYAVNYGYNPCWTAENLKENGITEKYKKDNFKERNETYYFLDSANYSLKRTGNFNDTLYVSNDTLSQMVILKNAINYLNAKEQN